MLDVVIVGSGPIGLFAGFYAGMRKLNGCIIESLPYVGGQLTTLYKDKEIFDIPTQKSIKAKDVIDQVYAQYKQFINEIPLYLNNELHSIKKIDGGYEIQTSKQKIECKTILFATGNGNFTPRKLTVEGNDAENILYKIDSIETFKDKKVVVLGGGDSALDWGVMLLENGIKTTIIHRRNEFRAHEETIEKFKSKNGIIKTPYDVVALNLKNNIVKEIIIKNKETENEEQIDTDYILVNYGFLPSKNKFSEIDINMEQGSFIVSSDMSTSCEGIYACGNAVTYKGKLKTIAVGFGEAATAITAINHYIFPNKNVANIYSSVAIKKED